MKDVSNPALECHALSRTIGERRILSGLDLTIGAGEVVALVGASGSGKTTLLRTIAGLAAADSGEIRLHGETVWSRDRAVPAESRNIGMVFQDYALWPHMTVAQNLRFGLEARHLPRNEIQRRVDHALEVTRLGPMRDRRPNQLSGGQQQRVAIARCLAARPRLLLLDEPLSNLDAALRDDLRSEMMRLIRAEGMSALYVTHDQIEAMAVSDRLAVMDRGQIVQFAPPQEVYDAPANRFVAQFLGGFSVIEGTLGEGCFRLADGRVRLRHVRTDVAGAAMLVVRPEDSRPPQADADENIAGEVVDSAYHGRCWRLQVRVGADIVRIDWPQAVASGAQLEFSLPPERRTVLTA